MLSKDSYMIYRSNREEVTKLQIYVIWPGFPA